MVNYGLTTKLNCALTTMVNYALTTKVNYALTTMVNYALTDITIHMHHASTHQVATNSLTYLLRYLVASYIPYLFIYLQYFPTYITT
jgi:hypothetical protein